MTGRDNWLIRIWSFITAFLPFRIILIHLKHNLFPLLIWVFFFMIVNDSLGYSFGIPFLFLSPEYLGEVNAWAFMILGFSFGGFTMGFNTFSYMQLGPHFPFLAAIDKPFLKFCFNNSLIPILFAIFYTYKVIVFQMNDELTSIGNIILYLTSFYGGLAIFLTFSFYYFFRLSKKNLKIGEHSEKPISSPFHKGSNWYLKFRTEKDRPYIYLGLKLKLMRSRSVKHLDQDLVERVFARNRINSSIYETLTVISFFILGAFNSFELMEVPAAASIVLLMTIGIMLFSALRSWLKNWIYVIMILIIFSMNYLSTRAGLFQYSSHLYGLDYNISDPYSNDRIIGLANNDELIESSKSEYIERLENWKKSTQEEKPKLVIINTSGGGSRSALWSLIVLQHIDKSTEGKLFKNTHLITGASGGMIGAAYFREVYLNYKNGKINNPYDKQYADNIGSDMLNRLSFMASTNDIFIRYQKYQYNSHSYTKDRGYAFEEQLHKNTNNLLDHDLQHYLIPEKKAQIPTMIFTPTIINDGRRIMIGTQNLSFLNERKNNGMASIEENVDIYSLLESQDPLKMRFSGILRANSTFPFVMPMVTIPTEPEIQLMDAGIRDNYGFKTMIAFLYSMREWIKENTDGVVLVQIRDTKNILDQQSYRSVSLLDKLTLPFGNIYRNFPRVQDYNQEELISIGSNSFDFPIDIVSFNLREKEEDRISLSWHLTTEEKKRISNSINNTSNRSAVKALQKILE